MGALFPGRRLQPADSGIGLPLYNNPTSPCYCALASRCGKIAIGTLLSEAVQEASLSSPDQLPDDGNEKTFTIQLNRDSLILLSAVGFLGIAILVAVLFSSPASAPTATPSVTARATSRTIDGRPTIAGVTAAPAATLNVALQPTVSQPGFTEVAIQPTTDPNPDITGPYPPPNNVTPTLSNPTSLAPSQATPTNAPPIFQPTVIVPTLQPTLLLPTPRPQATQTFAPTIAIPTLPPAPTRQPAPPALTRIVPTPQPTVPPVTILRGTTYWRIDKSPYTITQNLAIAPGSALIIEAGVEVRFAPGVSLFSEGKLYALGKPGQPVRFVGAAPQRWEGIFGRAGSEIVFEQVEVRGGGAGGTVLASESGTLVLRGTRLNDNGGQIRSNNSRLEVRDSEIAGNDMPYGAALEAIFRNGGTTTILNNRIGGNRLAAGASALLLQNDSGFDELTIDVQNNLLITQNGPNLTLATKTMQLRGNVICNSLLGGSNGLSILSETVQIPGFPLTIRNNAIDGHVPPIIPVYLKYGIGRGATSAVQIDMRTNWWRSDLGPYEPDRHADGRGDSVGENIAFDPWLGEWPSCAPRP